MGNIFLFRILFKGGKTSYWLGNTTHNHREKQIGKYTIGQSNFPSPPQSVP